MNGQVLGYQQRLDNGAQYVYWEHRDSSNASYRLTTSTSIITGKSGELDPLGTDMGTSAPPQQHLINYKSTYPGFGSYNGSGGTQCNVDFMERPCSEAFYMMSIGFAQQCPYNNCGPKVISDPAGHDHLVPLSTDPSTGALGYSYYSNDLHGLKGASFTGPGKGIDKNGNQLRKISDKGYWTFVGAEMQQQPWLFNVGVQTFTDQETARLRQAVEKIKSKGCEEWFNSLLGKLKGKADLPNTGGRPQNLDGLLEFSEFNRYSPNLTAEDMRISQAERNRISDNYEKVWFSGLANAVTVAPDFSRVYLMPSAFWQNTLLGTGTRDRDLSGIVAFELLHVAGFSDRVIWGYRDELQRHCGNISDLL
jgi:hypothetical protein